MTVIDADAICRAGVGVRAVVKRKDALRKESCVAGEGRKSHREGKMLLNPQEDWVGQIRRGD